MRRQIKSFFFAELDFSRALLRNFHSIPFDEKWLLAS